MSYNYALRSEPALVGITTFSNFSIYCFSVYVLCAQLRLAQR